MSERVIAGGTGGAPAEDGAAFQEVLAADLAAGVALSEHPERRCSGIAVWGPPPSHEQDNQRDQQDPESDPHQSPGDREATPGHRSERNRGHGAARRSRRIRSSSAAV